MKKLALPVIAALAFTTSCRQTKTVACDYSVLTLSGVGFSNTDMADAIVIKYQPDNAFDHALDTGKITYYLWQRDKTVSDSGNIDVLFAGDDNPTSTIPGQYDYVILVPATGERDTICNVTFTGKTQETLTYSSFYHDEPLACINGITSYKYNGQVYTIGVGIATTEVFLVK